MDPNGSLSAKEQ
jgi:hypothetical protein